MYVCVYNFQLCNKYWSSHLIITITIWLHNTLVDKITTTKSKKGDIYRNFPGLICDSLFSHCGTIDLALFGDLIRHTYTHEHLYDKLQVGFVVSEFVYQDESYCLR